MPAAVFLVLVLCVVNSASPSFAFQQGGRFDLECVGELVEWGKNAAKTRKPYTERFSIDLIQGVYRDSRNAMSEIYDFSEDEIILEFSRSEKNLGFIEHTVGINRGDGSGHYGFLIVKDGAILHGVSGLFSCSQRPFTSLGRGSTRP